MATRGQVRAAGFRPWPGINDNEATPWHRLGEAAKRAAEATIAAKVELVEKLKAMLAEARRPW